MSIIDAPPPYLPTDVDRLWGLVHAAVGAASMCWEHVDRAGVFQSDVASGVAYNLIQQLTELGYVDKFYAMPPSGYAR